MQSNDRRPFRGCSGSSNTSSLMEARELAQWMSERGGSQRDCRRDFHIEDAPHPLRGTSVQGLGLMLSGATHRRKVCRTHGITRPVSRKLDAMCQRLNKFINSVGSKGGALLYKRAGTHRRREPHNSFVGSACSSGADVGAVSHRAAVVWLVDARFSPQNAKLFRSHSRCDSTSGDALPRTFAI